MSDVLTSERAATLRELRQQLGPDHPDTMAAFEDRLIEALIEERRDNPELVWWWLSFADPDLAATISPDQRKPGGLSFLGVCVVQAHGPVGAGQVAHAIGANPGGEVAIWPIPPLTEDEVRQYACRLLSKADVEEWFR